MSELQSVYVPAASAPAAAWHELFAKEDWWAIWIGVALVLAAVVLFSAGLSIKWLAVAPQKWLYVLP